MLFYTLVIELSRDKLKRGLAMFGKKNDDRPIIQSSGYNGSEPTRICPNCGEEKPLSDFGYRHMGDGTIRNQSWCKDCRSSY